MGKAAPIMSADRRPRVHIRQEPRGASFSFGPCGARISATSLGEAFELAVAAAEGEAVVIFEGAGR